MPPLKDLLGKPGEGVHFHVCGIAVLDVFATIIVGCLLGWWMHSRTDLPPTLPAMTGCTLVLFLIGEMLHLAIGVETTVAKFLTSLLKN